MCGLKPPIPLFNFSGAAVICRTWGSGSSARCRAALRTSGTFARNTLFSSHYGASYLPLLPPIIPRSAQSFYIAADAGTD